MAVVLAVPPVVAPAALAASAAKPALVDAGTAPAARPTGARVGTGTWALSIGIDEYPGSRPDLRAAVADAVAFDRALAGLGVPDGQRVLLTDAAAGAGAVRRGLDWLAGHAGPDATVVLFYAGHAEELGPTTEAIVAADGARVLDVELARRLRPGAARRAWIVLAACYGAGFAEVAGPGRILTAAAGADDLAYERAQLGHSYLVEHLVRRAMTLGEARSVEAAFAVAAAELARTSPARVPVQDDRLEGELWLGDRGAAAPGEDLAPGSGRSEPLRARRQPAGGTAVAVLRAPPPGAGGACWRREWDSNPR